MFSQLTTSDKVIRLSKIYARVMVIAANISLYVGSILVQRLQMEDNTFIWTIIHNLWAAALIAYFLLW